MLGGWIEADRNITFASGLGLVLCSSFVLLGVAYYISYLLRIRDDRSADFVAIATVTLLPIVVLAYADSYHNLTLQVLQNLLFVVGIGGAFVFTKLNFGKEQAQLLKE